MARTDDQTKLTAPVIDQASGKHLIDVFAIGDSYAEAKILLDLGVKVAIETGVYD